MDSLILVNKPKGMTSHDVVYRVRKITGVKKVGHGGTLDPNASGLLVIGVGREATKKLGEFTKGMNKTYEAEIVLGEERDTYDSEGKVVFRYTGKMPSRDKVAKVLNSFEGKQKQMPPIHSAIKIGGKKAYDLARRGKEVKLEKRDIEIFSIELVGYSPGNLKIVVEVSSGTYIRSLAHDIGKKLKTGAYLKELKRTKIGEYLLENAVELEDIK